MTTYKTFNALLKIAADEEQLSDQDLLDEERRIAEENDNKEKRKRREKLQRQLDRASDATKAAREAVAANEPSKVLGDAWNIFYDDAKHKVGRVYNKGKQVVNGTINFLNSSADAV